MTYTVTSASRRRQTRFPSIEEGSAGCRRQLSGATDTHGRLIKQTIFHSIGQGGEKCGRQMRGAPNKHGRPIRLWRFRCNSTSFTLQSQTEAFWFFLSYFCRNHFNFEVSIEVSIPDVPRCINDVLSTLFWNFCITAVLLGFVYFWHYHAQANFLCLYRARNRNVIKINWKL
jgi:hypothetical protein